MPEPQSVILETRLRNLDGAMDELRAAAALDFGPVTQLVKSHFAKPTHDAGERKCFAAVIHELQYYDLLHQSIDHIQQLHHRLCKTVSNLAGRPTEHSHAVAHPLAQLNRLQFEVSCQGLGLAVEEILRLLQTAQTGGLFSQDCFANHNRVFNLADSITKQFHELAALSDRWDISDVQPRLAELNVLYSTATERTVLEQFIREPRISASRIIQILQHARTGASTIDLF